MSNLGKSLEKIFGVVLILFGAIIITGIIMSITDGDSDGIISDILVFFSCGLLPVYFGFKMFNGFNIFKNSSNKIKDDNKDNLNFLSKKKQSVTNTKRTQMLYLMRSNQKLKKKELLFFFQFIYFLF